MRRSTFGMFAATVLAMAGCGSGGTFANKPRPATPVNLTVYIDNARVSLSPNSVGAGAVVFIVTNQANNAQSLTIHPAGNSSRALANTGPINPQSTAQVTVDFRPGGYTVATARAGATDAAAAAGGSAIQAASLHIGPARASSSGALLQP